jgi:sulfite exporter TauE/SafE
MMLNFSKLWLFFLQGLILGAGPCLFTCLPILVPYLAGKEKSFQAGLKATLIFGFARTIVYTLLGGIVGLAGFGLFQLLGTFFWKKIIWSLAGVVIIILGILMVFQKNEPDQLCSIKKKSPFEASGSNLFLLGIIIGLAPCGPLISILLEVMLLTNSILAGIFYGLAFGLGTIISPLLLIGAAAPILPKKILKIKASLIYGLILIAFGLYAIISF